MNPTSFQEKFRWGFLIVGLALVFLFGPFQNCTVYESPDRKTMNEEGFPVDSDCSPYISQAKASEIMQSSNTKVMFLAPAESTPMTCSIAIPGTSPDGLNGYKCTFSNSNAAAAKGLPPTGSNPIGSSSAGPDEWYYTYIKQDSGDSGITTVIVSVGTQSGDGEGVRCGTSFSGVPSPQDQARAAEVTIALVREMIIGAP
jgi:hypothetical protein